MSASSRRLSYAISVGAGTRLLVGAGLFAFQTVGAHPPLPTPCLGSAPCPGGTSFSDTQGGKRTAGTAISGTTETITQTASKAVLNWADFNIAAGYTVNFVQPSSTAAALNLIWSGDESKIAGALTSNGQIYLYNQNGILFDKGAQINVGALTASTLLLPTSLFENGILSQNQAAASTGALLPVFQADVGPAGTPYAGDITVNPGAVLTAHDGGRIMLLGSAVTNQGSITTPDGQTILGAGNQVYLAASSDAALRGLLIEVSSAGVSSPTLGTLTNTSLGKITAPRGNVTLAGLVVNQAGLVSATTSVGANGSIYLVAGDAPALNAAAPGFGSLLPSTGGAVTLASGSVTEVLPDETGSATITAGNIGNFTPSQVNLVGGSVSLQGNATIRAPGGNVALDAAANPYQQLSNPAFVFHDTGRIYLDAGSTIDVSGLSEVPVAATRNLLQVTLETNDLQDDPLLRSGFLHGQTVTVNAAAGSTLFNVTPYANNIAVSIDEVLTAAGKIQLNADGDVIARAGSTLNVSGGSVAFQGGYGAATTKLLGANGKVYDIGSAPNNVQYVGVANNYSYTDPTWGTVTKGGSQSYYAGYLQGKSAGQIQVTAPQIYLQGSLLGRTVSGIYQRGAATAPLGGLLELGCNCLLSPGVNDFRAPSVTFADGQTDVLGDNFNYADPTSALPVGLQGTTTLSPALLAEGGFNRYTIFTNGIFSVPKGVDVNLSPHGVLAVTSDQSVDIEGNIHAPGAAVMVATTPTSTSDTAAHDLVVGAGAVIDVQGGWINDSPLLSSAPSAIQTIFNGGSVSLDAAGNLLVGAGSRIDVSGGGWVNSSNQLTAGTAGGINLTASYQSPDTGAYVGAVSLGAGSTLIGNSLAAGKGGTLTLASGSITVGTAAADTPGELLLGADFFANRGFNSYNLTGENDVLIGSKDPAQHEIVVVAPIQEILGLTKNALLQPTGANLAQFTQLTTLPATQRAPANLSFTTTASSTGPAAGDNGDIFIGADASLITDPSAPGSLAGISLTTAGGTGNITVLGRILVPAGNISLALGPKSLSLSQLGQGYIPDQQILLGPQASLDASGATRIDTLDALGHPEGTVLAGGSVSLQAYRGFVVTDAGSMIDVKGASGVIDIVGPTGVTPTVVYGSAGAISIDAREGLVLQGALDGAAAADQHGAALSGARGGSLSLGLDLFDYVKTVTFNNQQSVPGAFPTDPRTLTISDQPSTTLYAMQGGSPVLQSGSAEVSVSTINAGQFDNVTLKSADIVAFSGNVNLSARAGLTVDAPLLQSDAAANVHLAAPYVALGNYFNQSDYFDLPQFGGSTNPIAATAASPACAAAAVCDGSLVVNAQTIDLRGTSGWSGFAVESLTSSGDIRLVAALNPLNTPPTLGAPALDSSNPLLRAGLSESGKLTVQAQQVYPTTDADFTLNSDQSVTITRSSGVAATPLTAGGIVTINAPTILQDGVLRAPVGQITLNGLDTVDATTSSVAPGSVTLAAGSITSVSADGVVIPYGATVNGQQWTYSPVSGFTQVINSPLQKTISLNGSKVAVDKGSILDLSGGGDLYAYEFIAGPGGSKDILNNTNTYAIVPSLGTQFAPVDAQYLLQQVPTSGLPIAANATIYLSGVPGLAAGYYALLPAHYALLPGAFAVTIVKSNSDLAPGAAVAQPDGSYVVAARLGVAGTTSVDSRSSTVDVQPGGVIRQYSQYADSLANAFFQNAAAAQGSTPNLPADAGLLQLSATQSLELSGTNDFLAASYTLTGANGKPVVQQGAGGEVAIQSPVIRIVDAATPVISGAAPGLQLDAQALDSLGAQTLILGASAEKTATGETLTAAVTQSIELSNTSVALQGPEIIMVAQNGITLDAGVQLTAGGGKLAGSPSALDLHGVGSLVRIANGTVLPTVTDAPLVSGSALPQGTVSVGSGASLQAAAGSVLLFSTGDTLAPADAKIVAPALGLYSSRVSLGDVPGGAAAPSGLVIDSQLLNSLHGLTDLTIASSSTIDVYGAVHLGGNSLNNLTLDSWGINGYAGANAAGSPSAATLQAGSIALENTYSIAPTTLYGGANASPLSALTLTTAGAPAGRSGQILLGSGSKSINGFSAVTLDAGGAILSQGTNASFSVGTAAGSGVESLSLVGTQLTAAAGSDQRIAATGSVTLGPSGAAQAAAAAAPIGGKIEIDAASIAQNGSIDLPAGVVVLHANGGSAADGVVFGSGSVTSAAGAIKGFSVAESVASAGSITVIADNGSVAVRSGATVDVAGATSSDGSQSGSAGGVSIAAPNGTFTFGGANLTGAAAAGQMQGNFTLDVGSGLGGAGFTTLDRMLASGGFAGTVSLRTRSDSSVAIVDSIKAGSFELSVDQGSIDVAGTINTSGGNDPRGAAGDIALWAGTGLTLESGAQLLANAGAGGPVAVNGQSAPPHGGNITLSTAVGFVTLNGGTGPASTTTISMQGGGGADTDGSLTLRAPRTADGTNLQVLTNNAQAIAVDSRKPIVVEGTKVYTAASLGATDAPGVTGSLDVADQNGILFTDAQVFTANAAAIGSNLGLANIQVRPGIEVDTSGDLTLGSDWDLNSWSAALGSPVNLTLRAAGNLLIAGSLSDGFTNNGTPVASWDFGASGPVVDSASYRLIAGADLRAANPLSVVAQLAAPAVSASLGNGSVSELAPHSGNVVVSPGTLIRTGDGTIQVGAGGDVLLGYSVGVTPTYDASGNLQVTKTEPLTAVIYTAGVPFGLDAGQSAQFSASTGTGRTAFAASYPIDGGNVSISASDDIRSAPSAQLVTDWLWRRGAIVPSGTAPVANPDTNASWWIVFGDFEQGVGTLGGGALSLTAGGNVVDVSAVIPTTARLLGAPGAVLDPANLLLSGGGNLSVQAGGDIKGGVFQDDWGHANISASGAVRSGATLGDEISPRNQALLGLSPSQLGVATDPVLLLGSSDLNVSGRVGVNAGLIGDSTTLPQAIANSNALGFNRAYFFTYAPTSTVTLDSSGGDVTLNNSAGNLPIFILNRGTTSKVYDGANDPLIVPGTLNVAAYSGNINILTPIDLYPSATGNLVLLAQESISGVPGASYLSPSIQVQMYESDPANSANVATPTREPAGVSAILPQAPLHQADAQPVEIVASTGDISSSNMIFPKAADIVAGGNITDLSLASKNLNASDVTLIQAGGSVSYTTPADPVSNALQPNSNGINLSGPGFLEVLSGGSLNLGDSNGIVTTGGLNDARLPANGATIVAGAGFGKSADGSLRSPAVAGFIDKYLAPSGTGAASDYAAALLSYMQQFQANPATSLSYADALAQFKALPVQQQLPLVAQVLSDELSATGLAHSLHGTSYDRGYTAINTLFPTSDAKGNAVAYQGDINLYFSQIKTEQGGDVKLLAPGGSIVVGVPNPPGSLNIVKAPGFSPSVAAAQAVGQLGILVLGAGTVEGFADQNWDVNQSRILTLEGGDIILWASNGNIDAGRGAKSASSAPPPVIQYNSATDTFSVNPVNAISGSGIGQLLSGPGETAGLVNLIAPKGDVNAGDAGIRVAGNLNIAAVQVIGAGNITVSGTSSGVPVSEAGALSGALSGANSLGDASKNAVDQLSQDLGNNNSFQDLNNSLTPTFIVVKMFCLGVECETN